jgi:hypothetical protein
MSQNHQRDVRFKNYNFVNFGEIDFQILHCNVGASQAIGRAEGKKVVICKEMLEVLEELDPQ